MEPAHAHEQGAERPGDQQDHQGEGRSSGGAQTSEQAVRDGFRHHSPGKSADCDAH
jgi:hypothetical protein